MTYKPDDQDLKMLDDLITLASQHPSWKAMLRGHVLDMVYEAANWEEEVGGDSLGENPLALETAP